jgi:hypothetical protein
MNLPSHLFGNPESELPIGPGDQVFIWQEPDTKVVYHLNAASMYEYWMKHRNRGECALIPNNR